MPIPITQDRTDWAPITVAFDAHAIDNGSFHHGEHVRVAFDLLQTFDFIDAASRYAKGIRALAAKAGAPQKFNLTITYAFMSLIAERMATHPAGGFDDFVAAHPDLMTKQVLAKWYDEATLATDMARHIFLMPKAAEPAPLA